MAECTYCGSELAPEEVYRNDSKDFCSEKCSYEFRLFQVQNRSIELSDQIRILNTERLPLLPDKNLTVESQLQIVGLKHQQMLDEMDPNLLALHLEILQASINRTHEMMVRFKISKEVLKTHNKKVVEVEKQRIEQELPRQKQLRDQEIWILAYIEQNKCDRATAGLAFKHYSDREKAISNFLKIPGMTRENAEMMVNQSFKGLSSPKVN